MVVLSEDEIQRVFGAALAVMPPATQHFNLYFELGSDQLTPASQAMVAEVTAQVRGRVAIDVTVIGHTDTTGDTASNAALGLRRATLIRDLLIQAGLDGAVVDVRSHGESDPVVPTSRQHRRSKESARRSDNPLTTGMMSLSRSFISLLGPGLAIALAIWRPSILGEADLRIYDALVRADAAVTDTGTRAVVVAIDEASLARAGQWPWPRAVLATLVDQLHALGALGHRAGSAVAGSGTRRCGHRSRAGAALSQAPAVTAYAFLFDQPAPADACTQHPLALVERQRGDAPPSAGLLTATNGICTVSDLVSAAGGSGFINAGRDPDGLLRRVPLLLRFGDQVYPSLALAAARRALGGGPVVLDARSDGSMMMTVASRPVSLDAQGRLLLRLPPAARRPAPISAVDVLDGRVPREQIQGRVVFVGPTALGLGDVVMTAVDSSPARGRHPSGGGRHPSRRRRLRAPRVRGARGDCRQRVLRPGDRRDSSRAPGCWSRRSAA